MKTNCHSDTTLGLQAMAKKLSIKPKILKQNNYHEKLILLAKIGVILIAGYLFFVCQQCGRREC